MILDQLFKFASDQALTASAISTNVLDFGAAVSLFGGDNRDLRMWLNQTASGGTSPTIRAQLIGADNAALTTNAITIADTGTLTGAVQRVQATIGPQSAAKRFYGISFTLGGTSPTATVDVEIVESPQTNLV